MKNAEIELDFFIICFYFYLKFCPAIERYGKSVTCALVTSNIVTTSPRRTKRGGGANWFIDQIMDWRLLNIMLILFLTVYSKVKGMYSDKMYNVHIFLGGVFIGDLLFIIWGASQGKNWRNFYTRPIQCPKYTYAYIHTSSGLRKTMT